MCIINFVDLLYVSVVRVFCGFLAKVENFHARLRGNNTDRDEVLTKTYARTSMKNSSTPFSFFLQFQRKKQQIVLKHQKRQRKVNRFFCILYLLNFIFKKNIHSISIYLYDFLYICICIKFSFLRLNYCITKIK